MFSTLMIRRRNKVFGEKLARWRGKLETFFCLSVCMIGATHPLLFLHPD